MATKTPQQINSFMKLRSRARVSIRLSISTKMVTTLKNESLKVSRLVCGETASGVKARASSTMKASNFISSGQIVSPLPRDICEPK